MTHLGKPLCQKCWDRACADDGATQPDLPAGQAGVNPTVEVVTGQPLPKAKTARGRKTTGGKKTPTGQRPRRGANVAGDAKPKRVSALDAAAQVLAKAGKPMRCPDLVTTMTEQKLWSSPAGKTPHATLYSAILREIGAKGREARFTKTDRGQFAFNKEAK